MMDLSETPAVEPMDTGGDERVGLFVAGAVLIALGWLLGVAVNVVLHATAPAQGWRFASWGITHAFGPYAWAALLMGAVTGVIGVAIVLLARESPKGPMVLPGQPY